MVDEREATMSLLVAAWEINTVVVLQELNFIVYVNIKHILNYRLELRSRQITRGGIHTLVCSLIFSLSFSLCLSPSLSLPPFPKWIFGINPNHLG